MIGRRAGRSALNLRVASRVEWPCKLVTPGAKKTAYVVSQELGGRRMKIRQLVNGTARVCGLSTTLEDAARLMVEEETGSLGVVEGSKLAGIITERDFLRAAAQSADFPAGTVAEWMTPDPDTVGPDIPVDEVAEWMLAAGYRHLPIMEGSELFGIASIKDVLWALHSISIEPPPPDQVP